MVKDSRDKIDSCGWPEEAERNRGGMALSKIVLK